MTRRTFNRLCLLALLAQAAGFAVAAWRDPWLLPAPTSAVWLVAFSYVYGNLRGHFEDE